MIDLNPHAKKGSDNMSMVVCSGMFVFSITLEIINNLILIKKLADRGYRYDKSKILHFRILILTVGRTFLLNSTDRSFVKKILFL